MANSAGCTAIKCHWGSVLPPPGHKHATMGAGNMHLESELPKPRHVRPKLPQIPKAIQA